jgi:hypothetical protein
MNLSWERLSEQLPEIGCDYVSAVDKCRRAFEGPHLDEYPPKSAGSWVALTTAARRFRWPKNRPIRTGIRREGRALA